MKFLKPLLVCAGSAWLVACDDGRITLSVTDAPIDGAEEVVVQFSSVTFERDDGTRELVDLRPPLRIDLSRLTGELSEVVISEQPLPASGYRAIEFGIDGSQTTQESYVQLTNGGRLPLFVPDEVADDLRVRAEFVIDEEESVAATVDFDLRRSLFVVGDSVELRPQLRFIIDEDAASVSGSVAGTLLDSSCTPAVYAYDGADVTPGDVGGSGEEPISSAIVRLDSTTGDRRYTIGFLDAGDYTLALTCDADADDPAEEDGLEFVRTRNIELRTGRRATSNFQSEVPADLIIDFR